ncbi:hypothetical protein Dxin01_00830 [Deinococcus xinjiangensis]|uniref:Helicase n=1 Tax=Deinococcus xinjiangensis TaxID=457454 RepID=A0ABP9V751_9DEIO
MFSAATLAQQHQVFNLPFHVLLDTPTGSGKTWVACEAAKGVLEEGGKVIVLTPLKALAQEIAEDWADRCAPFVVQAYTRDQLKVRRYAGADVLVMTPERLDLITRQWRRHHKWLSRVRLLIADELQLIGDPERGAHYEGALCRIKTILPLCRIIAMTATCGNASALAQWLGAIHLQSQVRPVPLEWDVRCVNNGAAKDAQINNTVVQGLADGRQLLVFFRSRARAVTWAANFAAAGYAAQCHHAGLTPEERQATELSFRKGETRLICCTGTLELGINLPCDQVVLADLSHYEHGAWEALSVNTVWQRAGRAGRRVGQTALVTLIGTRQESPKRYLKGPFEKIGSALNQPRGALLFLLGSIEAGLISRPAQAERAMQRTFAQTKLRTTNLLQQLLQEGALQEEAGQLKLTELGRVASRTLLDLGAVKAGGLLPVGATAFDYFMTLAPFVSGPSALRDQDKPLLEAVYAQVPSRKLDQEEAPNQITLIRAALLHGACELGDEEAAQLYGIYPFQLKSLREQAARVVGAWQNLQPTQKGRLVRAMLETGLNLSAATLSLISGIGRVTSLKLAQHGIKDAEDLAQRDPSELTAFSALQVARWQQAAQALIKTFDEDPAREIPAGQRNHMVWNSEVDPQRLRRALTLKVQAAPNGFWVSGGEQPHFVSQEDHCDCADHLRVKHCKHVLAVKLYAKESHFNRLSDIIGAGAGEGILEK